MNEQLVLIFVAIVTGGLLLLATMLMVAARESAGKDIGSSISCTFVSLILYSLAMYIVFGGLA